MTATCPFTVPAGATWIATADLAHDNYRADYDAAHVANLGRDILDRGLQVLPVVTTSDMSPWLNGGPLVVSGNTRIVVMRDVLGMTVVPCEVRGYATRLAMLDDQVRENELRREVTRLDRVRVALKYRDVHAMTPASIGERMSLTAGQVSTLLMLGDRLSARSLEAWSTGLLLETNARELCRVDVDRQDSVIDLCKSRRFSVKAFEELVERIVDAQIEDSASGMFDAAEFSLVAQNMADDSNRLSGQHKAHP